MLNSIKGIRRFTIALSVICNVLTLDAMDGPNSWHLLRGVMHIILSPIDSTQYQTCLKLSNTLKRLSNYFAPVLGCETLLCFVFTFNISIAQSGSGFMSQQI